MAMLNLTDKQLEAGYAAIKALQEVLKVTEENATTDKEIEDILPWMENLSALGTPLATIGATIAQAKKAYQQKQIELSKNKEEEKAD